jgi:hypothetical protein
MIIDQECAKATCTGKGVFISAGKPCCSGLIQCPNGRCDSGCGTQ